MNKTNRTCSRRSLLGGALAAGIFPSIIPARAMGKEESTVAPSNRIVVASIGCGAQGTGLMNPFLGNKECQIVAVCDVDKDHLGSAQRKVNEAYKNNDCKTYADFRQVLARPDIDAVIIATPNQWHGILGVAAARAGKDIYIEKPLTLTLKEGRMLVQAAERHQRILQVGSMQRANGDFRFCCELARSGRLGKIHTVQVALLPGAGPVGPSIKKLPIKPPEILDYDMWLGPAPWTPYCEGRTHWDWRWLMDYGGGQMMDWIGHHGDIANWGMNWELTGPVEIEGKGLWTNDVLYDTAYGYRIKAKFADGVTLDIAEKAEPFGENFCDSPTGGTKFIGDQGWAWAQRGKMNASSKELLALRTSPELPRLYEARGHQANFLSCVKSRRQPICTAEIGHRAASLGHLGQIAMLTGRKLKWNPTTEEFADDAGATALLSRSMREPWHI